MPPICLNVAAALLLPLSLITGCTDGGTVPAPSVPPPAVSVAEVVSKVVTQWDEFTGHIEAVETVQVQPRVAGYVESVRFEEGEEVQKGDVRFIIDPRPFKARLASAEAELARARSRAQLAQLRALRAKKLLAKRVISEDEYDERVATAAQAQADLRAAEAAVEVARLDLEYSEVRSPIAGRTGRALVTAGNLVSGGDMIPTATLLTTVVSLDPVYVYFQSDEQTYLRYAAGAQSGAGTAAHRVLVGLANEADFPHQGRLDFIDNQVDPATGTIRARAVLDNRSRLFTPGLFARIKLLDSDSFPALLVDDQAILTDQDRKFVYVLGANNTAERRDVTIGRMVDRLRIVARGLASGDRVIVHGVQKVFFSGMPVAPQPIDMGSPPPATAGTAAPHQGE